MPRPKLHRNSIELDKEIVRIQRESQVEIERLRQARDEAEAAEDRRRGQLLREYLAGGHGAELLNLLEAISGSKDRALFGLPVLSVDYQAPAQALDGRDS